MANNKVWATDDDYPAGADPWNETPTKVEPDAAEVGAGHEPTVPPDAQVENWWKNQADLDRRVRAAIPGITPGPRLLDTTDPDFPTVEAIPTSYAYALSVGAARPKQGSANNKIKITAGTLFQMVDGQLLAYEFDGTDEVTIANGSGGTNRRIDYVQMKLELVTGVVEATINVKQGVPALLPLFPAPDVGFVPVAAVVVGEDFDGDFLFDTVSYSNDTSVLCDMRMPVNVRPYFVLAKDGLFDPAVWEPQYGTALLFDGVGIALKANTSAPDANTKLFIPSPTQKGRLLTVSIYSEGGAGAVAILTSLIGTGWLPEGLADISDIVQTTAFELLTSGWANIDGQPITASGAAYATGPTSPHGMPVWCSGLRNPHEFLSQGFGAPSKLGIQIEALTDMQVVGAVFYIAEGL